MPIRIKRDSDRGGYSPKRPSSGGFPSSSGSAGGGLGQFLPILLRLFGRNPKLMLLIAVIGVILYLFNGKGCSSLLQSEGSNSLSSLFTGAEFDINKYQQTEIFEPLSDNVRNPLPEKFSLEKYAPKRLNQGRQGSCVAWASAYAARTIMEARESGQSPQSVRFSPAFLYNQIALEDCQGAYLPEALKVMQNKGLAPFEDFPYNENSCSDRPDQQDLRIAEDFKIDGYQRLTLGDDPRSVDMLAIKQNIAQGAPVLIGMMVGGTFMQAMMGEERWYPDESDYAQRGFGGHAMCVIGYDDYAYASDMGGFQIMNSWGEEWGKNGIAWVSYADFAQFVREAYGLYPRADANAPRTNTLQARFGIVLNADDSDLGFNQGNDEGVFRTARKLRSGEEFKIEVTNNIPCYTYVIGLETNGQTYVLFPYTEKHSPYCGITGTRLFPRDHSLYPDEVGSRDYFAIVVSKKPLDYKQLNEKLSANSSTELTDKLTAVIGSHSASVKASRTIDFTVDFSEEETAWAVIEVMK
jgi:C1A family cysteine protease